MGLGDSLTANGGCVYSVSTQSADYNYNGPSWHMWAATVSGAKLQHLGNAATPGYTIQQIKSVHLPTILSAKPAFCTVLAGVNNLSTINAQDLSDLSSIYTQLNIAGITPVLCTIPPVSTSYYANVFKLNAWIKMQAHLHGYPLLDIYDICNAPGTTGYKSGYVQADNIHFTSAAAKPVGQALSNLLSQNSLAIPILTTGSSGEANLITNPLFTTDNAATPPVPTGWSSLSVMNSSFAAESSGFGRVWTITSTGNGYATSNAYSPLINPGDSILISFVLQATVPSGALIVYCQNGSSQIQWRLYYELDVPAGSAVSFVWKAPSPQANYTVAFNGTAANVSAQISRFTAINLSAIGVA